MKILFITPWYPTAERPAHGLFVRELAKAANLAGDVVVLHCAGFDSRLTLPWRLDRETGEGLTDGITTYRLWWRLSPLPKTSYLFYLWAVLQGVRRIAAEGFRPDILHAHVYEAAIAAMVAGKLLRIPVVVTEHFSAFWWNLVRGIELWLVRHAFRHAALVMPVSRALQRSLEARGVAARYRVVPNVVDTRTFFPKPAPQDHVATQILFAGTLDPSHKKGLPYLLRACELLHRRRDDWRLDIVGDGPARAEYEHLVDRLGLAGKVIFHGAKTKSELAAMMRDADLFVVPSLFETFSVVAAEALATGTPVLSTRCGGPEEFIGCQNGLLVPPADAGDLCRGLDEMLSHLVRYTPAEVARSSVERFSPERVGAQLHAAYREVKGSGPEIWSVGHSGHRAFIAEGWSVLDVGSGHHPHPRATVLLDKDLGPQEERSGKTAVRDGRSLVLGDAERLPFREHAFDYVIASHIAEHLPDPAGFCAELQHIAPRGYLECPGPLAEFLLGEPFHLWVVTATSSRLVFRPNPPKRRLVQRLSDSFYAVFYAGQQRSRPTLHLHGPTSPAAIRRLQWFLRRAWSSRLLRRWTWTRFPFDGPFEAHVRDH